MKKTAMAAVSTDPFTMYVYALAPDNQMYQLFVPIMPPEVRGLGWQPLGGTFVSPPAAVSDGALNQIVQIVALGVDNQMFFWNSRDATWVALGGTFAGKPVAVSRPKGVTDVFGLGFDQQIYHKVYDGFLWTPEWESLGGTFITPPAAVSWAYDRVDVFALGLGSQMFHRAWDGFKWLPWEALGGAFTSPPTAVSWGPNRLDVFGLGLDNAMFHKAWDGSQWLPSATDWEKLGEQAFTSPPAATARVNRLDVFGIGPANQMLWMHWVAGLGWSPWVDYGEVFNSAPVAVAIVADPNRPPRLDLLGFGADNQVLHRVLTELDFFVHAWETLEGRFVNP